MAPQRAVFPSEAWRSKLSARPPPSANPEASGATGSGQAAPDLRLPRERAIERFGVAPGQEADFLAWPET
eukprot:6049740-Pyramimonas_sp.AAC.1